MTQPIQNPSPEDITSSVREMYRHHPFPTAQRKHSYQHHAAYVRKVLESLGIDPRGKKFGDIACGTGLMLLDYAKEFPEAEFTGYDLSDASVERANQTLVSEGVTNAKAHVQDIMKLEVENQFDYILSWGTIHHLADQVKGVHNLCRALKPGGVLRTGIYGFYGNWERRIQREIARVVSGSLPQSDFESRIQIVREWAKGDRNFKNYYTAPPVDLDDDDWVVDEFLHVWEHHYPLREVVGWFQGEGMRVLRMTDYYNQEISLDIAQHSTSQPFIERVKALPFAEQCHIIDMIVRPYWLSLIVQKPA